MSDVRTSVSCWHPSSPYRAGEKAFRNDARADNMDNKRETATSKGQRAKSAEEKSLQGLCRLAGLESFRSEDLRDLSPRGWSGEIRLEA
ncbi:hypothetical protein HPB47_020257 [Ixodes persulcatus]|uniref:Uncharacterized protein n=1 Tax=Ixodes persulcatus TaxID=34615 RepID=A0AC60QFW9_IXOPE|nr:hypothetical protein HPB47_020257 [Ixodes persulcatus]